MPARAGFHSSGLAVSGFPNPETQFYTDEMHPIQLQT